MKLEILRTYVTLKANNHNIKPKVMTVGGFSIALDNVFIDYDHNESYAGWTDGYHGPEIDCEASPELEWCGRGGADVFYKNNKLVEDQEYHVFDEFDELPTITSITEVFYEAFTNIDEGIEYEFYPYDFAILVIDRDTNKEYEIEASQEVLQAYINQMIDEGLLTETA